MCMSAKPLRIPQTPARESEEDKLRKKRQEELARMQGREGRSATVLTSGLGGSGYGSSLTAPSVTGGTVLGSTKVATNTAGRA